jgi:hypothetical protein
MIRIILPFHLRTLAHASTEGTLEVECPVTPRRGAGHGHYQKSEARDPNRLRGAFSNMQRPRHPTASHFFLW